MRKYPILSNLVMMALAVLVICGLSLIFFNLWTHHGSTSVVPDVKGLPYSQALDVLDEANLEVEIADSIYDDTKRPGTVVEVWPKPGAVVKEGREVYLTIVSFSPRQIVIDTPLTDISSRQAISYLNSRGVTSIQIVRVPSEFPDMVVAVRCDGQYVTLGSKIPASSTVILEVGQVEDPTDALDATIDSLIQSDSDIEYQEPEVSTDEPLYD